MKKVLFALLLLSLLLPKPFAAALFDKEQLKKNDEQLFEVPFNISEDGLRLKFVVFRENKFGKDNYRIMVFDAVKDTIIQELRFIHRVPIDANIFILRDVNNDGNKDINILEGVDRKGNLVYKVWHYKGKESGFVLQGSSFVLETNP